MALIQGILTALMRSAGRILNTIFGWATTLLFGKVPKDRQIYLSILAFGSVVWIVLALGILFPGFAVWLLSFVRLPEWVNDNWIRLAMLIGAVALPLLMGFVCLKLVDPEQQPKTAPEKLRALGRGYLFTLGLAVTLIVLTLLAPLAKLRSLARRWTTQHVPILVEPGDYPEFVDEVQQALRMAGWETHRRPVHWMVSLPTRILSAIAGGFTKNLIGGNLVTLASDRLEVTLHPSDMVMDGKELDVAHARAALMEQLAFSRAYLTWDKEANELEDRLRQIWERLRAGSEEPLEPGLIRDLERVESDLRRLDIPYDEWQVLHRAKLLVERGMLQVQAGLVDRPRELTETPPEEAGAAVISNARRAESGGVLAHLATAATFGVMAWLGIKNARRGS